MMDQRNYCLLQLQYFKAILEPYCTVFLFIRRSVISLQFFYNDDSWRMIGLIQTRCTELNYIMTSTDPYNKGTSLLRTTGFVPWVPVLGRYNCTVSIRLVLIYVFHFSIVSGYTTYKLTFNLTESQSQSNQNNLYSQSCGTPEVTLCVHHTFRLETISSDKR